MKPISSGLVGLPGVAPAENAGEVRALWGRERYGNGTAFLTFLKSPEAAAVMRGFGYELF